MSIYAYNIEYDIANDLLYDLVEKEISEKIDSIFLSDETLNAIPSICYLGHYPYSKEELLFEPGAIKVTVYFSKKMKKSKYKMVEKEMKRTMLEFVYNQLDIFNKVYDKLEEGIFFE